MEETSIVIADDHAVFREGTRRLLDEEPDLTVVGEAGTGLEAVSVVRALEPNLVVMDIVMPGLTGIEATREIKRSHPGTAVLILSAYDDDQYVLGLLEAGAAGYLLKSAGGHELVQAIRAIAAGESVLDPVVMAKLLGRANGHAGHALSDHDDERPTEREMDVLRLAGAGLGNKEIAAELSLSLPTIKAHLVNIFNKMAVGSRTEAVLQAVRRGWIEVDGVTAGGGLAHGVEMAASDGAAPHDPAAGEHTARASHRAASGRGR